MERMLRLMSVHPRWMALLCGAVAALGYPPLGFWPVGIAGVAGLLWLLIGATGWRDAAMRGWLFGLAHFTLTNNWIATAFTHQAEMPAAMGWVAVPLVSVYLAIYPALAAGATRALIRKPAVLPLTILLAAVWIVGEWLRSWVFSGYAWGPLSLMLLGPYERPGMALLLPYTGTYALSALVILLAGLALWLATTRRWLPLGGSALAALAAMYLPQPAARPGPLALTLVQPDLRQEEMNDSSKYEEQFLRLARLSRPERDVDQRLVLWPESAVPDYLEPGYPQRYYDRMTAGGDPLLARRRIARVIGPDSLLLTGAVDLEIGADENDYLRALGAYNSITAIDDEGAIVGSYAKAHLVPGGEYLPLRGLLEPLGLTRLVAGTLDFIPGPGPRTVDLGGWGQAGMQICYEIVFSGETVDPANRPDYIFNPSNDGWFGFWGPPQHLAQARMRAIEEGLPVLRSTTTGISAVIDASGVVRAHIGMERADRIDGQVPLAKAPTLFARAGHWLTAFWALGFFLIWLVATRRRRR
ncbi:MAG: apolipoprotein N-acyltransferase [Alphaproteobacteria bacterium]|nr:apolipoprotein N-acyltransferase [Alphaproteobacteria bacterium]